ncbi:MAG: hypothetical protein IPK19_18535 [Chloroflexi bacterium]|nr:hypothetical protein [Chloroflexota bacterium]
MQKLRHENHVARLAEHQTVDAGPAIHLFQPAEQHALDDRVLRHILQGRLYSAGQFTQHLLHDLHQQIELVAIMLVERDAIDGGAVGDILDRDRLKPLFLDQSEQRLMQRPPCPPDPWIETFRVLQHIPRFCSLSYIGANLSVVMRSETRRMSFATDVV